jgi:hypothetical protein
VEVLLHAFNFGVRWKKLSTPCFGRVIPENNLAITFYRRRVGLRGGPDTVVETKIFAHTKNEKPIPYTI